MTIHAKQEKLGFNYSKNTLVRNVVETTLNKNTNRKGEYNMNEQKQKQEKKREELMKAALPLAEFLIQHYDPHTYAIVECGRVEIVSGQMTAQLPLND